MKKIILIFLSLLTTAYTYAQTLTVDPNGVLNLPKLVAQTTAGQIFFTGHQLGSTYSMPDAIFRAVTDNPNGAANFYYDGVTNGYRNFSVRADGQAYFAGNVGIGTANPSSKLQIGDFATNNNNQIVIPGVYNFEQVRLGQISNGNAELEFVNHSGYDNSYGVRLLADLDHGAPGLSFQYAPSSSSYNTLSYVTGMHMDLGGNVAIGTTSHPSGYKLAVIGNMITEGITVKLKSEWPDFVFDSKHKLCNLSEVKT